MERLLEVKDLKTSFSTKLGDVQAVRGVSFYLDKGEALGIVGESGCGKSVTMMTIMRLLSDNGKIIGGEIVFDGKNIENMTEKDMNNIRGNKIGMIFQDPMTSLNPLYTIGNQLIEPLIKHKNMSKKEAKETAIKMLNMVGIPSPESRMKQYPHEFSGGQRQRVGLARALILNPSLVVCDEPVSALDVSIQSQIINLLLDMQEELGLTYIFIAHDMSVVKYISTRIGVMYLGHLMEEGPTDDLFSMPLHPYTQALLSAVPNPNPRIRKERIALEGDIPAPIDPPSGCVFHTRCPYAMPICKTMAPKKREVMPEHFVSCHLTDSDIENKAEIK